MSVLWEAPELGLRLNVFPNPTSGYLSLNGDWAEGDQVRLINLWGQTLLQLALAPEQDELNLVGLPAGTYLLGLVRSGRLLKPSDW
ncbi:MAG: T9SS type A sorting domain-containing protein [Lewinella sp.]|nr:T9SS type A sorting domain-containing protein [Lewinella sp.]